MKREQWKTNFGFILACSGAAIGIGNIWRFPYLAAKHGTGTFLAVYLLMVIFIGVIALLSEFIVGYIGGKDIVSSYRKLGGKKWGIPAFGQIIASFLMLSFYIVISGWALSYVYLIVMGKISFDNNDISYYVDFFTKTRVNKIDIILFTEFFILLAGIVLMFGIKGIEKISHFFVPAIFILLGLLIIPVFFAGDILGNVLRFFSFDIMRVTSSLLLDAMGQAFFSLSLGTGIMVTYSIYARKKINMLKATAIVVSLDTIFSIVAAFIITTMLNSYSGYAASYTAHKTDLSFFIMPSIFSQLPFGKWFALIFFVLICLSSFTTVIANLEVVISYFVNRGQNRMVVMIFSILIVIIISIPHILDFTVPILNMHVTAVFEFILDNIAIPILTISTAILVAWVIGKDVISKIKMNNKISPVVLSAWFFILKFITPILISIIIISGLVR